MLLRSLDFELGTDAADHKRNAFLIQRKSDEHCVAVVKQAAYHNTVKSGNTVVNMVENEHKKHKYLTTNIT